jgi:hypothetical protein
MSILLALALTAAAPAPTPAAAASRYDPNQLICETVAQTGTRLGQRRRCATRAQWAEIRRTLRQELERAQTNQVNPQDMNAAERLMAEGRYMGGLTPPH